MGRISHDAKKRFALSNKAGPSPAYAIDGESVTWDRYGAYDANVSQDATGPGDGTARASGKTLGSVFSWARASHPARRKSTTGYRRTSNRREGHA